MKTVLAFDFGASSGRAIKALYDGEKISYEEIHRFDNIPITVDGHVCHDVDMIKSEIDKAIEKAGQVDALAFDTWGVDYGLLDESGKLIHLPFHYRDTRTETAVEDASKKMSLDSLYLATGNQIMSLNTLFQLTVDENVKKADKLLFMPDLFSYMLTGNKVCEMSIASTSQMLSPEKKTWNKDVLNTFEIDETLFPELVESATVNGEYKGIKVISVAGHDTQCAVAAMSVTDSDAAFLSCGTWSLIGCELDEPMLTLESNQKELSNEMGANGKVNYLKNISGLWLIQETRRDLAKQGQKYSYNDLEMMARSSKPFKCFIDPDAPMLSAHGDLPNKIRKYCEKTGQEIPETVGEIVRCIYESLALKYRYALQQISECTGKNFGVLNILGGGTKDAFLCEMAANSINIPVVAGPIEATALGNIILQLKALGEIESVDDGRKLIAKTEKTKKYMPQRSEDWDGAYNTYKELLNREEK
ncbi:MAG: rhamnulokinase [Clostridia bacterium]|nr:rhamnulokinase [Clostridia bacterium]